MPMPRAARDEPQRLHIEVRGFVQGVGFRPFVYRLATTLGLGGWVCNHLRGVAIEVEGPAAQIQAFLDGLTRQKPPMAHIDAVHTRPVPLQGATVFHIRHSETAGSPAAWILPDLATCPECLAEVLNPHDRRYGYPFTNCTHCGPRFSIILRLPYDRPNTTMGRFVICPACRQEYENPLDRRFHAQPNACPECGPTLAFYTTAPPAEAVPTADFPQRVGPWGLQGVAEQALQAAVRALREGHIVAVKGLGGFHLMVDAQNAAAIARLRARKPRPAKPLALMVPDLETARALAEVSPLEAQWLQSPQAPIVLLRARQPLAVAANIAPRNPYLGIMLPYTPLHHGLLRAFGGPVVATSGNRTGEPICTDEAEAMERLTPVAEAFLVHNRPIARHVDDSVVQQVNRHIQVLRRARGFVPWPVSWPDPLPPILAVGAHLKNTIAVGFQQQILVSQYIGDLDTAPTLAAFERVIADWLRLYAVQPTVVAHDLHPDYASTHWVKQRHRAGDWPWEGDAPPRIVAVQHHHAHLAACLAEHRAAGPALGVTWDGTGYGPDGSVWGGEFLLGDARAFQRVATLRAFHLPGGDAAIKAPKRVALALLWALSGEQALEQDHLPPLRALTDQERRVLVQMLRRGFNAPPSTSMGRLFDAVASLLGLHQTVSFEGQAAMALEFLVDPHERGVYPLPLRDEQPPWRLDWFPLLQAIIEDLKRGIRPARIAARFHRALVQGVVAVARRVACPQVVLTGGVFQNRVLSVWTRQALEAEGFTVLEHHQMPPNDASISLGQVAVAAARFGTAE